MGKTFILSLLGKKIFVLEISHPTVDGTVICLCFDSFTDHLLGIFSLCMRAVMAPEQWSPAWDWSNTLHHACGWEEGSERWRRGQAAHLTGMVVTLRERWAGKSQALPRVSIFRPWNSASNVGIKNQLQHFCAEKLHSSCLGVSIFFLYFPLPVPFFITYLFLLLKNSHQMTSAK